MRSEVLEAGAPEPEPGEAAPGRPMGEFFPLVYEELRSLGRSLMSQEAAGHTLQPTVLIHDVYLKLLGQRNTGWNDEAHFKAVAATAMRRLLIDHARARHSGKRGGGRPKPLEGTEPSHAAHDSGFAGPLDLLALDDALRALHLASPRQARVVELRYFGGMTFEQVAHVLAVSPNTAKNDWRFARAWLQRHLNGPAAT